MEIQLQDPANPTNVVKLAEIAEKLDFGNVQKKECESESLKCKNRKAETNKAQPSNEVCSALDQRTVRKHLCQS